jgi:hypothetical protein
MSFLNILKTLLGNTKQTENVPADTSWQGTEAYFAKHMAEIEVEAGTFINKYGTDFFSFFYRPDADLFIRQEVLTFRSPDNTQNHFLDNDHWKKKHYLNFPGPFYTGETDTCGTGIIEAPHNVLLDADSLEFIFKQPETYAEFLCVIDAAAVEVFDSYSSNGNNNWTYQKCKDWWKDKAQMLSQLNSPEYYNKNVNGMQLYIDYLNGDAETDLRKYCYFLENRFYPASDIVRLPEL